MTTDADRAAIERYVDSLDIDSWAPLSSAERDLIRRALAPAPSHEIDSRADPPRPAA